MFTNKYKNDILKFVDEYFSEYTLDSLDIFANTNWEDKDGKPKKELIFASYKSDFSTIIEEFFDELVSHVRQDTDFLCFSNQNNFDECISEFFKSRLWNNKITKTTKEKFENLKTINEEKFNLLAEQIAKLKIHYKNKYVDLYNEFTYSFGAKLVQENKIHICPYCKRNYINVIDTKDKNGDDVFIKPDLDHFYPKSIYPFLACSIENLIPSCQVCNSRLKGEIDFYKNSHSHPLQSDEDIFQKIKFDYNKNQNIQIIRIENKKYLQQNDKFKNTLQTFKIEDVYNTHQEILNDILNKNKKYNQVRKKYIKKVISNLSEVRIKNLVFHEYKNLNDKKHPLAKLKKDLFNKIVK